MKLAGYALSVFGVTLIIQSSVLTLLGWDSRNWEKYSIVHLSTQVNAKTAGSARALSGVVYFVEANYQFLVDGKLKDGSNVTFGKNDFRDQSSAVAFMNNVKNSNYVYYNRYLSLSCLNNEVKNPVFSIIVGISILLISRIYFRKKIS